MGRTHTPKYRIEVREQGQRAMRVFACWYVKDKGKTTNKNLESWVEHFNTSLEPGGVNEHCGPKARISEAKIVNQKTGETLAHHQTPMFQVF